MKKGLIIVLAFIFSNEVWGQPPTRFYTTFGGEGDDVGYSGKVTLDQQYIIAGSTSSFGNDNSDIYLVKLSTMGQGLWQKHYGGIGNEVGKAVIQLADSGFVIAGYTSSYGAGGYDAYILKTDKAGNFVWQRTFGGADWDFANDLALGADGNIFVVGYTQSFGSGKSDGFILKYDVSGNLLTQKFIGGAENDELRSIIKTNDNFLATVGYTESKTDLNGDMYFMKLNLNGDTLSTKTIPGPYTDYANDIVQKSNNDYVICGARTYSIDGKSRSYMYSFTGTGSFLWEKDYYSSSGDEFFTSLANSSQLSSLTGYLRNVPVPGVKIQGNLIVGTFGGWNYKINSFGGFEDEMFYSIENTSDGGYIVVGSTFSFNSLGKDIFVIKHDSTCYNYTSVVGIDDTFSIMDRPKIRYAGVNSFIVEFSSGELPEMLKVVSIEGNIVDSYQVESKQLILNCSAYSNSIYIFQFIYRDGRYLYDKILKE